MTDDLGATDDTEETFTVGDGAATPRRSASSAGHEQRQQHRASRVQRALLSVQAGDALLLFASQGSTTALTGPGAGWTQIGRVADGEVTTVWRKVAHGRETPASTVAPGQRDDVHQGRADPGGLPRDRHERPGGLDHRCGGAGQHRQHTSRRRWPTAPNGAWRVSYWSDKSSATTAWTAPGGETVPGDDCRAPAVAG